MAAAKGFELLISLLLLLWIGDVKGDFTIQSNEYCGGYEHYKEERILDVDKLTITSHGGRRSYSPNKDCIITIIGKTYHQWEVNITKIDIDAYQDDCRQESAPCCNDYLKIFNSYRVDNARLFPIIPWRGLCGNKLPRRTSFVSTQNYITVQFYANPVADYKSGFSLTLTQYPRRNSGAQLGYFGGWNDGTLNQMQIDWSAQERIPGDYRPVENPTFDFEIDGIGCYECDGCKRDYFDTDDIGVYTQEGCFVCTKEWLQGIALAKRQCLTRRTFAERLLTLQDPSGGSSVEEYRGCKTFLRGTQGTTYINLCICDSNKCNKGQHLKVNSVISVTLALLTSVLILLC